MPATKTTAKSSNTVVEQQPVLRDFPVAGPVTIEEVAAFLQVSESTVQRLFNAGHLKKRKLPGTRLVRFEAEQVRKYQKSAK
jgi:excisionase family DNA binding protein